jgi:hypothetical protein
MNAISVDLKGIVELLILLFLSIAAAAATTCHFVICVFI